MHRKSGNEGCNKSSIKGMYDDDLMMYVYISWMLYISLYHACGTVEVSWEDTFRLSRMLRYWTQCALLQPHAVDWTIPIFVSISL